MVNSTSQYRGLPCFSHSTWHPLQQCKCESYKACFGTVIIKIPPEHFRVKALGRVAVAVTLLKVLATAFLSPLLVRMFTFDILKATLIWIDIQAALYIFKAFRHPVLTTSKYRLDGTVVQASLTTDSSCGTTLYSNNAFTGISYRRKRGT